METITTEKLIHWRWTGIMVLTATLRFLDDKYLYKNNFCLLFVFGCLFYTYVLICLHSYIMAYVIDMNKTMSQVLAWEVTSFDQRNNDLPILEILT